MDAILKILIMSMSHISDDCIDVFHRFDNVGFAVGIVSISLFLAKIQVLPVYAGFMAAILKIVMTSMPHISGDCTVVFLTLENIGFAVGIVSISQFMAKLPVFPVYSRFYGRHLEFPADADIAHLC